VPLRSSSRCRSDASANLVPACPLPAASTRTAARNRTCLLRSGAASKYCIRLPNGPGDSTGSARTTPQRVPGFMH